MRLVLAPLCLLLATGPAAAQHGFGAREQWQPQIAPADPRLDQPVGIELIGRAAVAVTETLSEATGVSLGIAPEDLDTVGERKLTIISNGLTLKAIMVQIPEALQECHWDVDESGGQPAYVLHRNAGVEYTALKEELLARLQCEREDAGRTACAARVDEATRALRLSDRELSELEESDYLLAVALRDEASRASLEAFLALPEHLRQRFFDTGELSMKFAEAPSRIQGAARRQVERLYETAIQMATRHSEEIPPDSDFDKEAARRMATDFIENELPNTTLTFEDPFPPTASGVLLSVQGESGESEFVVVPPRYPPGGSGSPLIPFLLPIVDYDPEAAEELVGEWQRRGNEAEAAKLSRGGAAAESDSSPDELDIPFAIPDARVVVLPQLQRRIARETGIPIIADYATVAIIPVPDAARRERSLGRLLDLLSDATVGSAFYWELAGSCLVFHHRLWPVLALREIPESLAAPCRDSLQRHGRLGLADVAAFYAALADLPQSQEPILYWPDDLRDAGIPVPPDERWALILYDVLTSEQREIAQGPMGLTYGEMNARQQRLVEEVAAQPPMEIAVEHASQLRMHIAERAGEETGRAYVLHQFALEALGRPGAVRRASVRLLAVSPRSLPNQVREPGD